LIRAKFVTLAEGTGGKIEGGGRGQDTELMNLSLSSLTCVISLLLGNSVTKITDRAVNVAVHTPTVAVEPKSGLYTDQTTTKTTTTTTTTTIQ